MDETNPTPNYLKVKLEKADQQPSDLPETCISVELLTKEAELHKENIALSGSCSPEDVFSPCETQALSVCMDTTLPPGDYIRGRSYTEASLLKLPTGECTGNRHTPFQFDRHALARISTSPTLRRLRSAERRRSSVVVSLPGLEVFPGDLLVSDSAMDYLPHRVLMLSAETKKPKWPFAKRGIIFMSTLKYLQSNEFLLDVDSWRLFANLEELNKISLCFLKTFLETVKEYVSKSDSPMDFSSILRKWCEQNKQCKRLHLPELLVAPLHRLTRYPLLLHNIWKRSSDETEKGFFWSLKEKVEKSIRDLEGKVKWLDNFQKFKQLQEVIIWPQVWDRDRRFFVPEDLLVHSMLIVVFDNTPENTRLLDVYLFLFDDLLLITKMKRNKKKYGGSDTGLVPVCPCLTPELQSFIREGGFCTVLDQPIPLDRLILKNVNHVHSTASFTSGGYPLLDISQAQFIKGENSAVKSSFHLDVVALPRFAELGHSDP
ncbi:Plekhg7 [Columba guinea]|nr:Plekhg7 [Columba guinea]